MGVRLGALMFLQYAVLGAWVPLFSLILTELEFSPAEIAWASTTSALGSLLGPLPWGQIADRVLATERCISLCSFASGILLFVVSELRAPWAVFLVMLGFWFFMVPLISLGTALTFRHLAAPERQFGPVRMWGTIGWVTANLLLAGWFADPDFVCACMAYVRPLQPLSELADAFRLGGVFAFVLSVYAWTLPSTPPSPVRLEVHAARSRWAATFEAPLLAMRLLRKRSVLVLCTCLMGLYITFPFSIQLTPLLLEHSGVTRAWLPATLTIAQSLEITSLALLPLIVLRLEEKGTLVLGIFAWALALTVLTLGEPLWLVIASLGLHGIFITCFLVAGQVYINRQAAKDIRASAQALLQFINGIGLFSGNLLVGAIRTLDVRSFAPAFGVAAVLASVLAVLFLVGFRTEAEYTKPCGESLV
jgi:MFS family permease